MANIGLTADKYDEDIDTEDEEEVEEEEEEEEEEDEEVEDFKIHQPKTSSKNVVCQTAQSQYPVKTNIHIYSLSNLHLFGTMLLYPKYPSRMFNVYPMSNQPKSTDTPKNS